MGGYNGYKNWETWTMALWLGNDEGLYHTARKAYRLRGRFGSPYKALMALLGGDWVNGSGVSIRSRKVARKEVSEKIKDLALGT